MSLIWKSRWRDDPLRETSWRNRALDDPSFYPDSKSYRLFMSKIFLFFVPSRVPLPHYHHPPPAALPLSFFLNISCQDYISKRDVRRSKFISFSRFAIIESQFHQSQAIRGKSIWISELHVGVPFGKCFPFLAIFQQKEQNYMYHMWLHISYLRQW